MSTPCATNPDLFFSTRPECVKEAKRLCNGCDVRLACLSMALAQNEAHGVWGGLTEAERDRVASGQPPRSCALDTCHNGIGGHSNQRYCTTRCRYIAEEARRKTRKVTA